MPQLPEKLEITVSAKDWTEAKAKLAAVGIDQKSNITKRNINGLFVVMAQPQASVLTDGFYGLIKSHKDISILSDTASWKRNRALLNEIYEVEIELRKLLLHITDLVDAFYELFAKAQYAKNYAKHKAVSFKDDLNPLPARLMLGDMIDILGVNLSWSGKSLTADQLAKMLDNATTLSDLNKSLKAKLEVERPWSIISDHVLSVPVEWSKIKPKLDDLKDYRNMAAHFHITTEGEKDTGIALAKEVYGIITKQKPVSATQSRAIQALTKGISTDFERSILEMTKRIALMQPSILSVVEAMQNRDAGIQRAIAVNTDLAARIANLNLPNIPDIFGPNDLKSQ